MNVYIFQYNEQQNHTDHTDATQTFEPLTHWGRGMHIFLGNLTIIGSENGLPAGRRQSIIWPSTGILLIGPLGTII